MEESSFICPTEEELADVREMYNCTEDSCSSVFKNISNLRMHLTKHHKKGLLSNGIFSKDAKYVCPVPLCVYNANSNKNKWFTQRRLLKQHYMKVHAEKRHVCNKCNSKFSILSTFQRHVKICGAKFVCGVCKWEYNSNESLMVHLLRKHPEEHKKYIKNRKSEKLEEYIMQPNPNICDVNHLPTRVTFNLTTNEIHNIDDSNSNSSQHETSLVKENITSKLYNENRDCFTQTMVKAVKKSSHSKIKKLNAETQTSVCKEKAKRIDKSTNISRYSNKSYRTLGTQTLLESAQPGCSKDTPILCSPYNSSPLDMYTSYNHINHVNIETQTALDELLYSNLTKENDLEEDSALPSLSELIYISDIQTQTTWPTNSEAIDKLCQSTEYNFNDVLYGNDFISTETQTCHFPDFDNDNSSFDITSPYFKDSGCEYFPGDDFLDRNKVLRSDIFFSSETQTCFEDLLEDNSNETKESNKST